MSGGILAPQRANTQKLFSDSLSTRARQVDDTKYYVAELYQPATGLSFRAFVPESFGMNLQNHWEPIFGGAEGASSTAIGKTFQALGVSVSLKYLTRRIWVGSEPIDFNFTFLLDAYSSTFGDVEKPIRTLAKMASPYRKNGLLYAPGPDAVSDKYRIYLRIGKFMIIDSVIIQNIDFTFYSVADKADGRYMSADIGIHVSTNYTPDQDDIERFFNNGQSGDNSLDASNRTIVPNSVGDFVENLKESGKNTDIPSTISNKFNDYLGKIGSDPSLLSPG
jgi:hypothetical protein